MKKIFLIILCGCLTLVRLNAQIYFSALQEILPNDDTKFLVGDDLNRAKKISFATLKSLLGVGVYPTKVTTVSANNNPSIYRNKIVQTIDSLNYWVDWSGNSVLLGSFSISNYDAVTKSTAQTITGKKTFSEGLVSGGIIDTKGINTEGSATKAAISLKGVQSEKDTIVATNFTLDGRYGAVGFQTTTSDKEVTFPLESLTVGWVFTIRKENDDGHDLVLKNSLGVEFYRLKSKMLITVKNKNGQWKRER